MAITVIIQRRGEEDNATMGQMQVAGANIELPPIFTLEDRWRNNAKGESCIPAGTYRAVPHGWKDSDPVKFKKVWRLIDVPGRDAILIHAGNTDADTHGCILVGLTKGPARVQDSRRALDALRRAIGERVITVVVKDVK